MQADSDSVDGAGKKYILHSDCEGEMKKWIGAITEEMKPILGADIGLSSSYSNTPKPKIDQKAFDEVQT